MMLKANVNDVGYFDGVEGKIVIARSEATKQSPMVFVITSEGKQSPKERRNFIYVIAVLPSVARNDTLNVLPNY